MNPNPDQSGLKPFQPGQSGNPNGRPKKLPGLEKLLTEVLGDEDDPNSEISQILKKLAERAKTKYGDRAAEILIDRAYGKARQHIENSGESKLEVLVRYERKDSSNPTGTPPEPTEGN